MSLIGFSTNIGKGLLHQVAEGFRYIKELSKEYLGPSIHSIVSSVRENLSKAFFMKGSKDGNPSDFERTVIAPVAEHIFRGAGNAYKALTWLQKSKWHETAKKKESPEPKTVVADNHSGHGGHHAPADTIHDWGHYFSASEKAAQRSQMPEPEAGSDEWLIREEEGLKKTHQALIETEEASQPLPETLSEQLLMPGLIHEINTRRQQKGLSRLHMDSELTKKANHTASSAAADRYQVTPSDLLPYRLVPFLKRGEKKIGEAGQETDQEFAHRIRESAEKRKNDHHENYDEFTVRFDLMKGDIFGSNPKNVIDKIMEHPLYKEILVGERGKNKQAIGLGVQKKGTRTVITLFLTKDSGPSTADAEVRGAPLMNAYSDEEWFHQIPETERKKPTQESREIATIYELFHSIPSPEAPFRNGYTLYNYYLLKKKIKDLSDEGYDVEITRVQATRKNKIFGIDLEGIEITLLINGREERTVTLLKGTDTIVFTEKYTLDKQTHEEGKRQSYQSHGEFSEEMDNMCKPITGLISMIEEKFPGGRDKKKGKKRTAEEVATEAAAEDESETNRHLGLEA